MRLALVSFSVRPRAANWVARVAIKALMWHTPTRTPLTSPTAAAASSVPRKPAMTACTGLALPPAAWIISAPTAGARAITEPAERSMPPVRMMSVMPMEQMDSAADCRIMFIIVESLRN